MLQGYTIMRILYLYLLALLELLHHHDFLVFHLFSKILGISKGKFGRHRED